MVCDIGTHIMCSISVFTSILRLALYIRFQIINLNTCYFFCCNWRKILLHFPQKVDAQYIWRPTMLLYSYHSIIRSNEITSILRHYDRVLSLRSISLNSGGSKASKIGRVFPGTRIRSTKFHFRNFPYIYLLQQQLYLYIKWPTHARTTTDKLFYLKP